jgi:chemotaxis protein MotB
VARSLAVVGSLATAGLGTVSWNLYGEQNTIVAERDRLRRDNKSLSDALELHRGSAADLDGKLTSCKEELTTEKETRGAADQQVSKLEVALSTCEASMTDLDKQRREADARLREFKSFTERFQRMIDTGKLDVEFRRGQMVVKLPAAILFPSGSAELSAEGVQALKEVADVLEEMPRKRFTVAGHTDDVPVRTAQFASNWELSTARAVRVTKVLIDRGLRPHNLVAAGYAQFAPIASNRSNAGRQRNRRIEIILEPELRPLPELATALQTRGQDRR